jgi:biopolymer transport protein ExbD
MRRPPLAVSLVVLVLAAGAAVGCDSKPSPNPFETKKDTVEPPAITTPPKPTGPPELTVSAEGPKVGWTYILLDKPDGKQKLLTEINSNKEYFSGKDVSVRADRNSKLAHVAAMIGALADGGASSIVVSTETRTEFPKTVKFLPPAAGKDAKACSVVAKVLSERRNAVWTLKGGTAVKSPKGLAGPDMAMTEDSLDAAARRCKDSDFVFVSADDDVEWGLVYDLAAATQSLEKAKLGRVVLIEPAPVAGRPVKLD